MIVDRLVNMNLYEGLGEHIRRGLNYLANTNFNTMEVGRYEVDAENIFAIVNEYNTKPAEECEIEAHRKYIDIQFMVNGSELFGYTPLTDQVPSTPYNEESDFVLYNHKMSYIALTAGMFIIFFPTDIHQPEVQVLSSELVRKVVVKVRVD